MNQTAQSTAHGLKFPPRMEHQKAMFYRAEQFAKGVEAAEEALPGAQDEILSGKIQATDREIVAIAKAPKGKRSEIVKELRKPIQN